MFGFLKKFFGMDKETVKEANVQLEQSAPYKVEPPVPTPAPQPEVTPVESVVITVVEEKPVKTRKKPAAKKSDNKKPAAMKAAGEKKPRAKRSKNA